MKLHSIRLYLDPDPSGVYTVTSPDVPGLVTEGHTPDEILSNVQEALDALMDAWGKLGISVPPTGKVTAIPDWGSKDLVPGTVRAIIRELGISRAEFGPVK